MYLKAILLAFTGTFAAALLILNSPSWLTLLLIVVSVWAFCRAYYFAFYVIERYIDPSYRFSGLASFVRYLFSSIPSRH